MPSSAAIITCDRTSGTGRRITINSVTPAGSPILPSAVADAATAGVDAAAQEGAVEGAVTDDEVTLHRAVADDLTAGAEAGVQEGAVEGVTPPDGFLIEEDEVSLHRMVNDQLIEGEGVSIEFNAATQAYNIVRKPIIK